MKYETNYGKSYEVVTVGGVKKTFKTEPEMVGFVKAYAAKHHRLPKSVTSGSWKANSAQMLTYAEMEYIVKTVSGDSYCLNYESYCKFVALVALGARKAPEQLISLVEDRGCTFAFSSTKNFETQVKEYIEQVLAPLTPEQRLEMIQTLIKK